MNSLNTVLLDCCSYKIKTDLPALLKVHFWRTPEQASWTQESLPPPL